MKNENESFPQLILQIYKVLIKNKLKQINVINKISNNFTSFINKQTTL